MTIPKTASINGFADKIYDRLPECAKPCVKQDVRVSPCAYYDTQCLCMMPQFQNPVGMCIADNCHGEDVLDARSLATSICVSAQMWEPYWMPDDSVTSALEYAATASWDSNAITTTTTDENTETVPTETASNTLVTSAPTTTGADNPYTQYPSVAKTASINGFADRIYDQLPECAKSCMYQNTGVTPCPYWDTGCLCIMPTFQALIGQCIADNCHGQDVLGARSLATSICSSAGVWSPYWMPPDSISSSLAYAATAVVSTTEDQPSSASASASSSSTDASSTEDQTSSETVPASSSSEIAIPTETVNPLESFTVTAVFNGIANPFTNNGTSIKIGDGDSVSFVIEDGFLKIGDSQYIQVSDDGALFISEKSSATSGWGVNGNRLTFTAQAMSPAKRDDEAQFNACPADEGYDVHVGESQGCTPVEAYAENVEDTSLSSSVELSEQQTATSATSEESSATESTEQDSSSTTSNSLSNETPSESDASSSSSSSATVSSEESTSSSITSGQQSTTGNASSSDSLITSAPTSDDTGNQYTQYPSVAKTASIN
ncbi:hypothetical protein PP707_06365, partial [Acetobacter pasteurianus]|nr:hypothetical protein [Acetobacter pasteurianus]